MFGKKSNPIVVVESPLGIRNEAGQVALAYFQPSPKMVTVGKTSYVFTPQFAVSLAWVDEKDVAALLAMKKECCGGSENPMFRYATDGQVRTWTTGER